MRGRPHRSERADRRLGWLLAIPALLIGVWWVPEAAAQTGSFAPWWHAGGWLIAAAFLLMATAGLRLPMRMLRALWVGVSVLLLALQLSAFGAVRVDDDGLLPWVRFFDAPAACLLVLCLPAWAAVTASVATSLSMVLSAWIFSDDVPIVLLIDVPLRLSNVVFVALVIAMRGWLVRLHEAEDEARTAAERRARSAADAREQARLSRFVHDEVLSVLTAASLFTGRPPRELRAEADSALRALAVGPDALSSERSGQPRLDARATVERLRRRLAELAPHATIDAVSDGTPLEAAPLEALGDAAAEALRNAMRHARAGRISVRIAAHEGALDLRIADDGIGFDPERVPRSRLGVRESIVARVVEAGGSVRIDSAPGRGTEVRLSWRP